MKKLSFVAAALAAALTLSACGGTSEPEATGTSGPDQSAGEPITLTVWESLEGRADFIKQAGEAYTALNPNVTIEYKNVELTDALGQIALDGPAGVGPDVFAAPSNVSGDLVSAGHILPIRDEAALKENLVSAAIANATYDGKLYGVPVTVDTYALFYNKDLVTEVPETWADVIEFSKEFNSANSGKYGFAMQPNFYYAAPFLFDAESLLFGPEGTDPAAPNTNSDAAVKGLEEFMKFRDVLDIDAADLDTATVDSLFEGGQSAMHVTGAWNIPVFDAAGLNYGVAPLPKRDGQDTFSGGFSNSRTMYVSAYSEQSEAAQDFAAFLATPEMLKLAYDVTGSVPSADIAVDHEATVGMVAQGEYAFPTPSIPEMTAVWTSMDSAIANIWNGADIKSELDAATEVILAQ